MKVVHATIRGISGRAGRAARCR